MLKRHAGIPRSRGAAILALSHVFALLAAYTYVTLFPLSVIEGPIVTIVAGYLAYLGYVNPLAIYAVVVLGDLSGDFLWYAAGRWSRRGVRWRGAKYLGVTQSRLERVERHFETHSVSTLLLGKLTQGVGALVLVGAGAAKMRVWRFIVLNLVATLPKSLVLLLFGYFFGRVYEQAGSALDYAGLATIALTVIAVLVYVIPRRFAARLQ